MLAEGGEKIEEQLAYGFRRVCSRWPEPEELDILQQHFHASKQRFARAPEKARELMMVGKTKSMVSTGHADFAALTVVANSIFSFDEAYMKR
jgi:hypothetical protein